MKHDAEPDVYWPTHKKYSPDLFSGEALLRRKSHASAEDRK
jgi:hypothetical protein